MNEENSKVMQVLKFFTDANFYISVIVLVYGGLTAVTENYSVFAFNEDLYGAMHNNLRIALLYLAMTEIVVCMFSFATKQPKIMGFVGYFLLMMLGSLAFYGKINNVPIDRNIPVFFLYTGISHILYGMIMPVFDVTPAKRHF
jgi:hypothetical protein